MAQTDAEAGFTLIEVVCVLAIIGLLAALAEVVEEDSEAT